MKPCLKKEVLQAEAEEIAAQVKQWKLRAELAKKQLEYWQHQADALSTVSARYIFGDGGKNQSVEVLDK